jgi:hypothetical protein
MLIENAAILVAAETLIAAWIVLTSFLPWVGLFVLLFVAMLAMIVYGVHVHRAADLVSAKAGFANDMLVRERVPHSEILNPPPFDIGQKPIPSPWDAVHPHQQQQPQKAGTKVTSMSNLPIGEQHSMILFQRGKSLDGEDVGKLMAKRGVNFSQKEQMEQRTRQRRHQAELARNQVEYSTSGNRGGGQFLYLKGEESKYQNIKCIKQHLLGGQRFTARRLKHG